MVHGVHVYTYVLINGGCTGICSIHNLCPPSASLYCLDVCMAHNTVLLIVVSLCSYVKNARVCQTIQSRVTSHLFTLVVCVHGDCVISVCYIGVVYEYYNPAYEISKAKC